MELHIVPLARMTAIVGQGRNSPVKLDIKTDAGIVRVLAGEAERASLLAAMRGNGQSLRWRVHTNLGPADVMMMRDMAGAVADLLDIGAKRAA